MKNKCDRCGRDFSDGNYYTIDIYGKELNPTNDGRMSLDVASQNIATNVLKASNMQPRFCKHCIEEINAYINNKANLNGVCNTEGGQSAFPDVSISSNEMLRNLHSFEEIIRRSRKGEL